MLRLVLEMHQRKLGAEQIARHADVCGLVFCPGILNSHFLSDG
ncbi:hypothetical protein [Labilibaculum sp.]|nr:hypothetical protein [Labilibaculum sp.]